MRKLGTEVVFGEDLDEGEEPGILIYSDCFALMVF